MKKNLLLISVIGLGLVVQEGRAQQQPAPQPQNRRTTQQNSQQNTQRNRSQTSSQSTNAMTTASFVKKVAEDNQMEIDVSRMVSSRAKSTQVKDYAQQLIKDHTNTGDTLKRYASKHNITLPAGSTASSTSATSQSSASNTRSNTTTQKPQSDRNDTTTRTSQPDALARTDDSHDKELASKSGAEFDQAYIHMMVEDHQKAISAFEAQKNARDMDSELRAFVNNTLPVLRRHLSRAEALEKSLGSTTTDSRSNVTRSNPSPSNTSPSNNNPSTTNTPRTR